MCLEQVDENPGCRLQATMLHTGVGRHGFLNIPAMLCQGTQQLHVEIHIRDNTCMHEAQSSVLRPTRQFGRSVSAGAHP